MKNFKIKRIASYIVDFLIIGILVTLISQVKFLNPKYKEYSEAYAKYEEEYNKIINDENKTYKVTDDINKLMYEVSYYGISYTIIEFGVIVIYFTIFPLIFGGQTIGKKLLKLKIVNKNDDKKVNFFQYLFRAIIYPMFSSGLFYCALTLIINLSALLIFKYKYFLESNKVIIVIGLAWGYFDVIYSLLSKDNRSVHDIITKTKVIDINQS